MVCHRFCHARTCRVGHLAGSVERRTAVAGGGATQSGLRRGAPGGLDAQRRAGRACHARTFLPERRPRFAAASRTRVPSLSFGRRGGCGTGRYGRLPDPRERRHPQRSWRCPGTFPTTRSCQRVRGERLDVSTNVQLDDSRSGRGVRASDGTRSQPTAAITPWYDARDSAWRTTVPGGASQGLLTVPACDAVLHGGPDHRTASAPWPARRGMEKANVAPGPSFGAAQSRPP